jgi:hypothetical protein
MSSGMVLHSPDRQVPLDCPGRCHQADRRDGRTSDKVEVQVPFRVGSRLVQQVGPGQEEEGRKDNPKGTIFSHPRWPGAAQFFYEEFLIL